MKKTFALFFLLLAMTVLSVTAFAADSMWEYEEYTHD